MEKREFAMAVGEEMLRLLPSREWQEATLDVREVVKVNDVGLTALILRKDEHGPSPSFYMDRAYEDYQLGCSLTEIARSFAASCEQAVQDPPPGPEALADRPTGAPDELYGVRLLEARRNVRFLEDAVYRDMGAGLVLAYDLVAGDGIWRTTVRKEMLERSGMDPDRLHELAMERAFRDDPPRLITFGVDSSLPEARDLLGTEGPLLRKEEQLLVLTNLSCRYGAAALFAPGVSRRIAELLGEGYYVVPSSLHDLIIVPRTLGPDPEALTRMLRDINQAVVKEEDVLSDHVYLVDRNGRFLGKALQQAGVS